MTRTCVPPTFGVAVTLGIGLATAALPLASAGYLAPAAAKCALPWALWEAYAGHFLSDDGRIIEGGRMGAPQRSQRTTSEAQAYALFFALVAGERTRFDRILRWTEENLAGGDLTQRLPAWLWGKSDSGKWQVLDENSAADADLWLSYTLFEAARVWNAPDYAQRAASLAHLIVERETVRVGRRRVLLLPAPHGFEEQKDQVWRLNPSYLPVQLLRRMSQLHPEGPWRAVRRSTLRMLKQTAPHGLVADWVAFQRNKGFVVDPVVGAVGSYDAIRAYLWAGMLHPRDEAKRELESVLDGMYAHWMAHGWLPEKVNSRTGWKTSRRAPVGFLAALLPRAAADSKTLARLESLIAAERRGALYGDPPPYYDQNLILFGQGYVQGRYRFDASGTLRLGWEQTCTERD